MPAMSEEARKTAVEAAIAAIAPNELERRSLVWQGESRLFPVVKLPLDAVVLNRRSHRIRAQVESDSQRQVIEDDPYSDAAQIAIAGILRRTEDFEALKNNLNQEGQREPGVVTRAGVLINANTRTVALRDLGEQYIRVIVLSPNATESELDELELTIQMAREFRQDYTFTNELLFVNDLLNTHRRSLRYIALALRWADSTSDAEVRRAEQRVTEWQQILSIVRDLQNRSGGRIPLTDFDDKRQALQEINRQYQELSASDQALAENVKSARLLGLLTGLGYRELRFFDEDFLTDHLVPALMDDETLGDHSPHMWAEGPEGAAVDLPGLDLPGLDDQPAQPGVNVLPLVKRVAESTADEVIEVRSAAGEVEINREAFVVALRGALMNAVDLARADRKAGGRLARPAAMLKDVTAKLSRVIRAFEDVADDAQFDRAKFNQMYASFQAAAEKLEQSLHAH
ncbi:MAG: hypothetical protein ACKVS8_08830 [Phycisphaerales bacterium]